MALATSPIFLLLVLVVAGIAGLVIYRVLQSDSGRPEAVATRFVETLFQPRREIALERLRFHREYFAIDTSAQKRLDDLARDIERRLFHKATVLSVEPKEHATAVRVVVLYEGGRSEELVLTLQEIEGEWRVLLAPFSPIYAWERDLENALEPWKRADPYLASGAF